MGDGMPGNLAKGRSLLAIDRALNDRGRRLKLLSALRACRDGTTVVGFFRHQHIMPKPLMEHLEQHVFDQPPPGFWPGYQKKDAIVREGLIKALELAMDGRDLDVDSYWVCSGHHFQVAVALSPKQVSVLFLTPPRPAIIARPAPVLDEDLWVFVNEDDKEYFVELSKLPVIDAGSGSLRSPKPSELEQMRETPPGSGVWELRTKRA